MANYKIEDIEGIGPSKGEKFREAGVKDTDSLLNHVHTPAQRKALAEKTGVSPKLILRFANMADLYRIRGIGSEFSELLEASNVNTVPQLATRNAKNLHQRMLAVNEEKKLTRRVPSEKELSGWIEEANSLPRLLTY